MEYRIPNYSTSSGPPYHIRLGSFYTSAWTRSLCLQGQGGFGLWDSCPGLRGAPLTDGRNPSHVVPQGPYILTTIVELGPQNNTKDGLLGPNSIAAVYIDPLGAQTSARFTELSRTCPHSQDRFQSTQQSQTYTFPTSQSLQDTTTLNPKPEAL